MKYFTSMVPNRDISIGITSLLSNITQKDHSHKGGWTKILRCQLLTAGYNNVTIIDNKSGLADFDTIIFDLGAEFGGTINLFGGLDGKALSRVQELRAFKGDLYSWQHEVPCLDEIISMRQSNKSTHPSFIGMPKLNLSIKTFDHVEHKDHLLYGDSHAPSVWTPDMMIDRADGRTMYGILRDEKLKDAIEQYKPRKITVYAGNIDARHHICRTDDATRAIVEIVVNLGRQISDFDGDVELVKLLPIESESRKLPGTGYYKGTPFFGSWFDRNVARTAANVVLGNIAEEHGYELYDWPVEFVNELGELTFDAMERPKSVHLSPMSYRWDLNNNIRRY